MCTAEVGLLGCYPRREAMCSLSQTHVFATFDGSSMPFPDESSFYLVKTLGRLPANVSVVEVKIGRKLVNKGPTWKRPIVIRVAHLETQIGGSDFDVVKVCIGCISLETFLFLLPLSKSCQIFVIANSTNVFGCY